NDLVRRYLWMAALSATQCNPAVRALYQRVAAKHADHKAIAVGHAMRKLLHLAFALWKTGRPFDPDYPAGAKKAQARRKRELSIEGRAETEGSNDQAAGHTPGQEPATEVVTAACACTVASGSGIGAGICVDFAHLKSQLPMAKVLDQLGLSGRLRGSGA